MGGKILDVTGKLIYEQTFNTEKQTINFSEKGKGIYFYRVTNQSKLIQQGKISIQ